MKKLSINEIVSCLTEDEKTLLKDTIKYGSWGDTEVDFLDENNNVCNLPCYGYCTNDAKKGNHFKGRKISGLFSSMLKKLCKDDIGYIFSYYSDYWGDNSGDMLFIRSEYTEDFEKWASDK